MVGWYWRISHPCQFIGLAKVSNHRFLVLSCPACPFQKCETAIYNLAYKCLSPLFQTQTAHHSTPTPNLCHIHSFFFFFFFCHRFISSLIRFAMATYLTVTRSSSLAVSVSRGWPTTRLGFWQQLTSISRRSVGAWCKVSVLSRTSDVLGHGAK